MPVWLLRVTLSLLAGVLAIAGLNLAFPGEIVRAIGGVSFPALLASLPGLGAAIRGLPLLTAWAMQWAMARQVALRAVIGRAVVALREGLTGSRTRVALALNAVLAVFSVPSLIRLMKWVTGAS